jgi:hypothetical protein
MPSPKQLPRSEEKHKMLREKRENALNDARDHCAVSSSRIWLGGWG